MKATDHERARLLLERADQLDQLSASATVDQLALLAAFDPHQLAAVDGLSDITAFLCDRLSDVDGREQWLLADGPRVDALARILGRHGPDGLRNTRKQLPWALDSPLQRMIDLAVFNPGKDTTELSEDELVALLRVRDWLAQASAAAGMSAVVTTPLERDEIQARLALIEVTRAVRALTGNGCIGRDAELERLHRYCDSPNQSAYLHDEPPMLVYGIGGIGKSTLVARFVVDIIERPSDAQPGWAYLDLDRPTLSGYEPRAILGDISRQFGAQHVTRRRLLQARQHATVSKSVGVGLEAEYGRDDWEEAAVEFASEVEQEANGRLVVILDTFEEAQRADVVQLNALYELFALLARELRSFKLIVSGRAPATNVFRSVPNDRLLHVEELKREAALELLEVFYARALKDNELPASPLGESLGLEAIALVGGNPLTLWLAARVLASFGGEAVADAAQRARAIDRVKGEFVNGFLYQRVLNHLRAPIEIADSVRTVARASLALREVTAELVAQVVLPAAGLEGADAGSIFDALRSETALMSADGPVLRVRDEVRSPALRALDFDDPALIDAVHRHAIEFYRDRDSDSDRAERVYHQLALGVSPAELDATLLDVSIARRLESSLTDLPAASEAVLRAALNRDEVLTEEREQWQWERSAESRADAALRAGRFDDAEAVLSERSHWSERTTLHRLQSLLREGTGDVPGALASARRELGAASAAGDANRFAAAAVRIARLEEQSCNGEAAAEALRTAGEATWMTGEYALRLELLLNWMNTMERSGATGEWRWTLGLEARKLIQRVGPEVVRTNTALVRLMAAALGEEEPQRIRDAVRQVGLGYEEDTARVLVLARALAAWVKPPVHPGRLARDARLAADVTDQEVLVNGWSQGLSGSGVQAGMLLSQLWDEGRPPSPVLDALRDIYLWWGIPRESIDGSPSDHTMAHFLDAPIDFTRMDARSFESIVGEAYPNTTDLRVLLDQANLDQSRIDWQQSARTIIREAILDAQVRGQITDLVQAMLGDEATLSFRDQISDLVGSDWMEENNITFPSADPE